MVHYIVRGLAADWNSGLREAQEAKLASWHWETDPRPFRPRTGVRMCVTTDGLHVLLSTQETNPLARYTERDADVCEDSCLEFFLAPKADDARYVNIEVNPNGAYFSSIGADREKRAFLKDLSELAPTVEAMPLARGLHDSVSGWCAHIFLPLTLLQALYGADFMFYDGQRMRGNFYKCGDKTAAPHWGAWSPVTSCPPGFHNPDCFGTLVLSTREG